jgi:hypothetical protein
MGVVKVSKSGKAVLFISDGGEVYVVSSSFLKSVLERGNHSEVVLLTRLSRGVDPSRFKVSPVFGSVGVSGDVRDGDGLSKRSIDSQALAVMYLDKVVDL